MSRRARLAAMAMFVASCGLLPAEPDAPFPADGVGAFGDAAPVEVCLGTARVVAPALATGAAALCVPEGAVFRACAADGDCEGIERCICGRCIVEPCQGAGSCKGGTVCRGKRCTLACGADADCKAGERCVSGGCARTCGRDGDCHAGEHCDGLDDVCVTSLCGSGGTCGSSSHCEAVAEVAELGEPTFLGSEPRAFVSLSRAGEVGIFGVAIDSAERWTILGEEPVLVVPGETHISAPSVVRRAEKLELYAEVGAPPHIARAISTDDGATFSIDVDPLLVALEPWEAGAVGSPSAVDFDGRTYLFYEGGSGAGIGLVEIADGKAERLGEGPVVSPADVEDPIFWRGISAVRAPFAWVMDGAVRLAFTARGVEGFSATGPSGELPPDANDSIGLASTTDLTTYSFFPTGPVYARLVNLRAYLGEREASVLIGPSGAEMVFVSSDATGADTTGIYRAVGRGFSP